MALKGARPMLAEYLRRYPAKRFNGGGSGSGQDDAGAQAHGRALAWLDRRRPNRVGQFSSTIWNKDGRGEPACRTIPRFLNGIACRPATEPDAQMEWRNSDPVVKLSSLYGHTENAATSEW
jgi:hypothetical protein